MKYYLLIFALVYGITTKAQNCTALYSYGANFTNVHFFNQSNVSNAHYYWSFGDGTGANLKNPIHEFTESGTYLVTLYVFDTTSGCTSYYDQWLSIVKSFTDACAPSITDSLFTIDGNKYYVKIKDNSFNCNSYNPTYYNVGNFSSGPIDNSFGLGYYKGNFISTAYYFDNSFPKRAAVKTTPNYMDRSKNYQPCSANFEMLQISEDVNGQRILFKAMNKTALSYDWTIPGFGDPLRSTNDTISVYYGGNPYSTLPNFAHDAILAVKEQNGCRDSLRQFVVVKSKNSTYVSISKINNETLNVSVYPNPVKNKLNLEFEPNKLKLDKLTITNTLGQIVFTLNEPQAKEEIDLSFLDCGLYFVKVQNKEGEKVMKILIE
jgi:hypothetical protein